MGWQAVPPGVFTASSGLTPSRQFLIASCRASAARLLQCILTGGRPSRASATSLRVTLSASSNVMPGTSSVIMLEVATAEPQPNVWNLMSLMRSSWTSM